MRIVHLTMKFGLVLVVLMACSLPRGAALQKEILKTSETETPQFALYPVSRTLVPQVAKWPMTGEQKSYPWINHRHQGSAYVIAPGDMVNLTIWDSEANSLLTGQDQKVVEMKGVELSPNGMIFVPYLEKIHIAGDTPDAARSEIQRLMEAIIPSAQVQMTVVPGQRNSVELIGGVAKPDVFPMTSDGLSVLGLISRGGGVRNGLRNPQVRLLRGNNTYGVSVDRLFEEPNLDTGLRGGDKVLVQEDKRYFRSLGAAGKEQLVYFEKDQISALDAMSLVGGVSDSRADPKGILVLREYPASAVRSDGSGPSHQRAIFTIDLTTSDGLFSAAKLDIHSGDTVLVTESPINNARTVIGLIGGIFGIANTASTLGN
jgi:polysaccharide export outer membrane protein